MAFPLPTYPKAIQDMIYLLGKTVMGDRAEEGTAAPVAVPGANKAKVLAALQQNPNLTEDQYARIQAWLAGGELGDPDLAAWVLQVTGGVPVEDAGPMVAPSIPVAGMPGGVAARVAPPSPTWGQVPMGAGLAIAGEQLARTMPLPMSAANDNGIGGGGPEGAAAQAQVAQQATLPPGAGMQAPKAATAPPTTPGLPVAGAGSAPAATPGAPPWATDVGGAALLEDEGARGRFAGRAANLDPDTGGIASRFFQQSTAPMVNGLAQFYGYLPGGNGDTDPTKFGGDLGNFAKMFVTPGQSGVKWSKEMAQQILSNPEFMSQLLDVEDTDQIGQLQGLMQLLHPSVSGLKGAYLDRQSSNLANRYTDSAVGLLPGSSVGQYGGRFTNFLDQDPQARAVAERIFGYKPR